jgi:mitogen-activated protein kinase 1/3
MNKLKNAIEKKYEIIEMVGNGSYGTVMKAKDLKTGENVALKVMKSQPKMEYEIIKLLRELQLMRALNKINGQFFADKNCFVPKLIDIICPETKSVVVNRRSIGEKMVKKDADLSQLCIVMEYIETDLDQLMKHQIDFTEHHLLKVIYNCLLAINFVHLSNVMHRDIKPANILLDSKCHVKVCDFGLARSLPQSVSIDKNSISTNRMRESTAKRAESADKLHEEIAKSLLEDRPRRKNQKRFMSLHVGSRWYRAPEISIIEKQYDQASDMWSFGCILYELIMYLLHQKQESKEFDSKF